ncbi:cobalamin biosynthesis protein CobQ [Epibacterium ulvae]|uniref:cobalamin biosynthesis protein CobQ n=1 Tax=Epibacterium ulvae TaxID=1156985 RepID=UPI00248FF3E0|nr:cobalamin biosynthesis protein CobQ [Epibacterium ulvae]
MNTPAHLLVGAALFGRKQGRAPLAAALFGSLLPDLSLYVMVSWSLFVQGISPRVVFGELYFSEDWQQVFAIDNSIPLWLVLLGLALWSRKFWLVALTASALLHVGLDFFMHAGDGRPNFWPFSDWVFHSPVSYWDSRYYAGWLAPVTFAASTVSCAVLMPQRGWRMRGFILVLWFAELWTTWRMLTFF